MRVCCALNPISTLQSTRMDATMTDPKAEFQSATLDAWAKAAAKSAPGGNVEALNWITPVRHPGAVGNLIAADGPPPGLVAGPGPRRAHADSA